MGCYAYRLPPDFRCTQREAEPLQAGQAALHCIRAVSVTGRRVHAMQCHTAVPQACESVSAQSLPVPSTCVHVNLMSSTSCSACQQEDLDELFASSSGKSSRRQDSKGKGSSTGTGSHAGGEEAAASAALRGSTGGPASRDAEAAAGRGPLPRSLAAALPVRGCGLLGYSTWLQAGAGGFIVAGTSEYLHAYSHMVGGRRSLAPLYLVMILCLYLLLTMPACRRMSSSCCA
jgi:hypothetical protein